MYTHYWHRNTSKEVTSAQWSKICNAFTKIYSDCRQKGIELVREYDEPGTKPDVTSGIIFFNGSDNEGHETMVLERTATGRVRDGEVFAFCKTVRKPYDVAVTALLLAAEFYAPGVWRFGSDGDREDWQAGIDLFEKVTGQNAPNLKMFEEN